MVMHHIPDEYLMAYSAGILPESFSLVVASHVSLSDDSRARLEAFDAVGGAVLETVAPGEVTDDSLAATLALIGGAPPDPAPAAAPVATGIFPGPLQAYVGGDVDTVAWRPIGKGARQAILVSGESASVRLLYIPSGIAMPDHGHHGTEMTLVLQGAFRDESGEFHRGDIELADASDQHTPVAIGPTPCICLTATDARLRFKTLLPRLAQPFLRI
ncbi:MAG: ChrR family anti-sigma-E factor [Rhodobacteraceae bacterium]|nr:ChrR family anti-sigma-E factor [Paracoccaceae bacterium]